MAAEWVAAGVAAAGLMSNLFSNKEKKSSSGQQGLEKLAAALFQETDPIRQLTINRAMNAMLTGKADTPVTAARRSAIQSSQGQLRTQTEEQLGRQGLLDSSYGQSKLEDVDRLTSSMLVQSDMSELERLTQLGEGLGFATLPTQAGSLSSLANLQTSQNLAAMTRQQQSGQASGALLGLLLSQYLGNKPTTTTTGAVGGGSSFGF